MRQGSVEDWQTGIEVGWYPVGDEDIMLYANQYGVCIARLRVPLIAELVAGCGLQKETRDYLARAINLDLRTLLTDDERGNSEESAGDSAWG